MKRAIKFRGKRLANDEWCYGSLLIWADGDCNILEMSDSSNAVWKREIAPSTVSQFTGLYDKKGKEIYEGDIIQFPDGDIVDVEYSDSECSFIGGIERLGFLPTDKATIIGNIHDNPELLKGGIK